MKYDYFKLRFGYINLQKYSPEMIQGPSDHRNKGHLTIISVFTASGYDKRCIFGTFLN